MGDKSTLTLPSTVHEKHRLVFPIVKKDVKLRTRMDEKGRPKAPVKGKITFRLTRDKIEGGKFMN